METKGDARMDIVLRLCQNGFVEIILTLIKQIICCLERTHVLVNVSVSGLDSDNAINIIQR